jgi:uncharacterized protein (TIGR00299 family) protein
MYFAYLDASAGLSGDMILGALLDLGVSPSVFKKKISELGLPVEIEVKETKRASLRGLRVNVEVTPEKSPGRKWKDIESLIKNSPFSSSVKTNALQIFKNLFKAEARVHGQKFQLTRLHEASADDAIVDVVGACFLAEKLKIDTFYCSPLNVGQGWVKASHGLLPVPPPAVAELLKEIPVYSSWAKQELVTPTGAAIVSTLVKKIIPFPEMSYKKIGCGAGRRNLPRFPNILRVFYGREDTFSVDKRVYMIEANIDDCSPQVIGAFFDTAFQLGALDVFLTPIFMKKNRSATKLTLITGIDKMDRLIEAVLKETTSIGVRYFPVERRVLERESLTVKVLGATIAVKMATLDGQEVNIQPEFKDCLRLAKKHNLPVKQVIQLALEEFAKKRGKAR